MFNQTESPAEQIQLLNFKNDNKSVTLTEGSLERLFLNPLVSDREVVLISIAGALRKGKSFLLNYMLRYLYANVICRLSEKIYISNLKNFFFSTNQFRTLIRLSMKRKQKIGSAIKMTRLPVSHGSQVQSVKQRGFFSGLMFSSMTHRTMIKLPFTWSTLKDCLIISAHLQIIFAFFH
jgi:Guanylate-binding protein, N-terminal domain